MFLKINNSAQYCWKNYKNNYCWTNSKNDRKIQHAACSSDKHMLKSVNKNNFEFVNQSDSWNLMKWKSCDFITIFEYHKNL